jgi:hypothetical protein
MTLNFPSFSIQPPIKFPKTLDCFIIPTLLLFMKSIGTKRHPRKSINTFYNIPVEYNHKLLYDGIKNNL